MADRICSIDGCDKPHLARGWCRTHYARWQRTGDPGPAHLLIESVSTLDDLQRKVFAGLELSPDGCLLWTGNLNKDGYGRVGGGRTGYQPYVHQLMYEWFIGPMPEGMEPDHLCRVRRCAAPACLEAVTHRENVQRGNAGMPGRSKTHCPKRHEYTPENTYVPPSGGRSCRACRREAVRCYRAGKKQPQ